MKLGVCSAILGSIILMTCLGCSEPGPTAVEVQGTVTLDGKPLGNSTVGFSAISEGLAAQHRYASAVTDSMGHFKIARVYPAEYLVTLNEANPTVSPVQNAAFSGNPKLAKYSLNSPLRAKVSKESATFKFDVTSSR